MSGKLTQATFVLLLLAQYSFAQAVSDSTRLESSSPADTIKTATVSKNSGDTTKLGGNINLSARDSLQAGKAKASLNINMSDSLNSNNGNKGFNIRYILNKICFNFNIGYGQTFYSNKLDGYGAVRDPGTDKGLFIFPLDSSFNLANGSKSFVAAQNWLNNPRYRQITVNPEDSLRMIRGDEKLLKFRGSSPAVPISLTLFYSFLDRFRAGAGIQMEFGKLPVMSPVNGEKILGKYYPDKSNTLFLKYYGMVGSKIYELYGWTYYADLEIGKIEMLNTFNNQYISRSLFFNLGFPMEFEFSEYLSAVVRPSVEYKSYNLNMGLLGTVHHLYPSAYLTFGFKYNIPEAPRCPLHAKFPADKNWPKNFTNKTCRIQTKHYHNGKLYRGQPFYKPQNPDIGQDYKNLIMYKLFNRRKLSGGC